MPKWKTELSHNLKLHNTDPKDWMQNCRGFISLQTTTITHWRSRHLWSTNSAQDGNHPSEHNHPGSGESIWRTFENSGIDKQEKPFRVETVVKWVCPISHSDGELWNCIWFHDHQHCNLDFHCLSLLLVQSKKNTQKLISNFGNPPLFPCEKPKILYHCTFSIREKEIYGIGGTVRSSKANHREFHLSLSHFILNCLLCLNFLLYLSLTLFLSLSLSLSLTDTLKPALAVEERERGQQSMSDSQTKLLYCCILNSIK